MWLHLQLLQHCHNNKMNYGLKLFTTFFAYLCNLINIVQCFLYLVCTLSTGITDSIAITPTQNLFC